MHKRHAKVIIAINWLHNISNFTSIFDYPYNTILNNHNFVQEEKKEGKEEKRERLTITPS